MNVEAIEKRIRTLIENAEKTPKGRVDALLEPLRETLKEARRKGVRLRVLYDVVKEEGVPVSPGSFAKYAQRHLPPRRKRNAAPPKHEKGTETGLPPSA